jgi:anti-sigma B factor antagonist
MPPEFAITEQSIDAERHVLAVRGEIDLFTAPELKQVLAESIEAGRNRIIVDLTETTFLDSTALGVLIGAVKRLRSRHGALAIVNVDENIAKTFEITGLDQIFTILPTREEAVEAVGAARDSAGCQSAQPSRRSSTAASIGP